MEKTLPAESSSETIVGDDANVAKASESIAIGRGLVFGSLFLVIAADFLMWNQRLGLGFALFSIICGSLILLSRRVGGGWRRSGTWIWWTVLLVVCGLNAVSIDPIGIGLYLVVLLFGVGQLASPLVVPFWLKLIEGILSVLRVPVSLHNFSWQRNSKQSEGRDGLLSLFSQLGKWFKVVMPAVLLCVPFVILLLSGNAVMRSVSGDKFSILMDWFGDLQPPTEARMFFWVVTLLVGGALLVKMKPVTTGVILKESFAAPKDLSTAIWQTRVCLLMVNVLFLVVNWTDLTFLWGKKSLPEGVNYSQFVHEGTWSLVACVFLAAAVLSFFFFQHRDVCKARGMRLLGHLWILQNLFLVAGVILRVHLYIDAWQLSLLRIYLVSALVLISIGFLLLSIRIQWNKSFSWLVSANVVAIFLVLLGLHAWDERRYVAEYNVAAITEKSDGIVDLDYLEKLGSSAAPAIKKVASDPDRFGNSVATKAEKILAKLKEKKAVEDWRSLQLGELWNG